MSFGSLTAGNLSQFNSQIDQLILQALQAESQPIRQLEERKTSIQTQQGIFDQAASSLTNLQTRAETLGDSVFDQRLAETSNPSIVDVAVGPGASPGNYELTVQQLAKAHTLASHRLPAGGFNLAQFIGPGERYFNIISQGQRVEVSFEIPETMAETGEPPSNEDILRLITSAIRQANADAGLGNLGFTADAIRDTSSSLRLVVKSNQPGSANQLFLEDPQGVLTVLGINPGVKADEMNGGYVNGPEGQNKVRQEVVDFLQPIADLSPENVPAVSQELANIANAAAQISDGEGLPLAQSLANVINLLNDNGDITDDIGLELAFDSIADLVDRVDDQAVDALAREFLRRAGELRGPQDRARPVSSQPETPVPGTDPELARAFETLAEGIWLLGQQQDVETAFSQFRTALQELTTEDRAGLLQQFNEVLNGINGLGRKEGDELAADFYEMIDPLFDLTIDERSSVAVQFFNIADIAQNVSPNGGQEVAAEFRALGDLVEGLSQPLSDPVETPYSALYAVFYVLPPDTKATIASQLEDFASQLDGVDQSNIAEVFRGLAGAVTDPDIHDNFTHHFNDFATAVGSLNIEDRLTVRNEMAAFADQISRLVPQDQAMLLYPNFQTLIRSIDELNAFQTAALEDQMIAVSESIDRLVTDERAVVREEMVKALGNLRTVFPIDLPDEVNDAFAAFNGTANDLSQEDRNILSAEFARYADQTKLGGAFEALSKAAFYAGEPGSLDIHHEEFLWRLGALSDQDRQQLFADLNAIADRLPSLIGEDSIPVVPALREMAQVMSQPVVFEGQAVQFLSAFEQAASATGVFNDTELEEINRYLPELAEVLARNVNDRHHDLVQNLFTAGQSLAQLSPGAQDAMRMVFEQSSLNLGGALGGTDGQEINDNLDELIGALEAFDTFEDLDARFTLDGIPIIRSTNTINDLLDGVTLHLNNVTDPNAPNLSNRVVQLKIDNDDEGFMQGIQEFLDAYNETIKFIEDQTAVDADTSERGALAGDQDYVRLRLDLRGAINGAIHLDDRVTFLREIGLGIGTGVNDSNQIRIEDSALLREALTNDPALVQLLLGDSEQGVAGRISALADKYLRPEGVIAKDRSLLDRNVERLDDRIDTLSGRIDTREDYLRNEYNAIAEQLLTLTSQTDTLQSFWG